jgi:uncharacterized membrane protein
VCGKRRQYARRRLFPPGAWTLAAIGLGMLWNALRNDAPGSGRSLLGWMLAGWGIFNVVEGVIDHLILGVHHVNEALKRRGTLAFWYSASC